MSSNVTSKSNVACGERTVCVARAVHHGELRLGGEKRGPGRYGMYTIEALLESGRERTPLTIAEFIKAHSDDDK